MRAVLDTSVLIGLESGRGIGIDDLPDESALSVVTLAELRLGVLAAASADARAARLATLAFAERHFESLEIDSDTATLYARIQAQASAEGRRIGVQDAWIAATAMRHDARLLTHDHDFTKIDGLDLVLV